MDQLTPEVQEKLNSLEKLLFEFYNASTHCSRKKELEKMFEDFSNDSHVWSHIRDFVKFSTNVSVLHFSLMVTENTLKLHGVCTDTELWTEMKYILQNKVLTMDTAPIYLIHRIVKVNAHIARIDWPHFYPDYFPNIFKLVQSGNEYHVILGAKCLQITSEEFLSPREDVSFARKTELKSFLASRVVPDIFTLLLRALEVWKSNMKIIGSVLESLEQYFSWVPLSEVYSVALVDSICQFTSKLEVGIQALTTLNEILYKALVPVSSLPVLYSVISHSVTLIENVAVLSLHNIPMEYLTKVTENMKLVISHHWRHVETILNASQRHAFLVSFLGYTFASRVLRDIMYECLEIWKSLFGGLGEQKIQQLGPYQPIISNLLNKLMEEIHASSNLDDEDLNEDNKTEKQECLDHCNEVLVKIMQLFPHETLDLVLSYWEPVSQTYAQFLSNHNSYKLQMTPDKLSAMCNYTQVLTRLHQCSNTTRGPDILQTLARVAHDFTRSQIYRNPEYRRQSKLLVQVQGEVLASLKCWISTSTSVESISSLYPATIPLILDKELPHKLYHASLHLLASVILTASSCELGALEPLLIPNALGHLPLESRVILEGALIRSILSKPLTAPSSDRLYVLQSVMNILIRNTTVECKHLSLLLPHCQLTTKLSKQTLHTVLEAWLSQVLVEYPRHFEKHNFRLCEDMVAFVLEAFRVLQDQIPLQYVQNSVSCFIDCFQSAMTKEFHNILDKLFLLLQVIVEQPSAQFNLFVPSSLELCMRIINLPDETRVPKYNAYNLLALILNEKWQYFFRSSQLDPDAEAHFCSILSCLGQSCVSADVTLVRQTVLALEAIQARWRLYEKDIFKSRFLHGFLSTYLLLLIENQHALLNEDLTQALHHLAQVDMPGFYAEFIPRFLLELAGVTDSQRHQLHSQLQTHTDFSTFTQNITQLCNDIRCFKKFNKNNPPPQ